MLAENKRVSNALHHEKLLSEQFDSPQALDNIDENLSEETRQTTDTVSNGLLEHELRCLRTKLIEASIELHNERLVNNGVKSELENRIDSLTRQLTYATTRLRTATEAAGQTDDLKTQLNQEILMRNSLMTKHSSLVSEYADLRRFLLEIPTNHLIYMDDSGSGKFRIDIEAHSRTTKQELIKLETEDLANLSTIELLKIQLNRLTTLFVKNTPKLVVDSNGKHVRFCEHHVNSDANVEQLISSGVVSHISANHNSKSDLRTLQTERDQAVAEVERLRTLLENTSGQPPSSEQSGYNSQQTPCDDQPSIPSDRTFLQKRLLRATIEVDNARNSRNDALLLVEKLTTQLETAKKAYTELQTNSKSQQVMTESEIAGLKNKLSEYEELEAHLDNVLEDMAGNINDRPCVEKLATELSKHMEHLCYPTLDGYLILPTLSTRRMDHAMRLSKQLNSLKDEYEKSTKEMMKKTILNRKLEKKVHKFESVVFFQGQPVNRLVNTLAEQESETKMLRKTLNLITRQLSEKTARLSQLEKERDLLAEDLKRLLDCRQNIGEIRNMMATHCFVTDGVDNQSNHKGLHLKRITVNSRDTTHYDMPYTTDRS